MRIRALVALALVASASTSCASLGAVDDGTSVSFGGSSGGRLKNGVRLVRKGDGYLIPDTWAKRGLNWGTEELVGLLVRASRRVDHETPGSTLYVADLSPRLGGPSAWHRSHQSGRDADLHFFAVDQEGNPAAPPESMVQFGDDGMTPAFDAAGNPIPRLVFDVPRNWSLVRALLEDPVVDVQYLFIYEPLEQLLVAHAREIGEPEELIGRAQALLHQPGDSLPHDDHLHVRIYCPPTDRGLGCLDRGPLRWFKKSYKYLQSRGLVPDVEDEATSCLGRPFCRFVAARNLAFL
jgi:penicillin-insensitive murein endopeptidase